MTDGYSKKDESTYIVSGKPYISENRAIMNASYIPGVCFFTASLH